LLELVCVALAKTVAPALIVAGKETEPLFAKELADKVTGELALFVMKYEPEAWAAADPAVRTVAAKAAAANSERMTNSIG